MMRIKEFILMVAIDVDTSSGYVYSFRDDCVNDHCRVFLSYQECEVGFLRKMCEKVPTCVLLNPEREFLAFGYKAENMYSDLFLEEKHSDYYFFKEFRMMFHETCELSRTTLMKDVKGKEAPALCILSHVIRYLKNQVLRVIETKRLPILNEDTHWVLPVPAIWDYSAKQFMTEAAKKAGIQTEHLSMCLKPEAAFTYCQHAPSIDLRGICETPSLRTFSSGTKFMIIHLEDKSAEVHIYQKHSNGTLEELHIPTGGPWGGSKVNEAFNQIIIKIGGTCCLQEFKDVFKTDYVELHREFNIKKMTFKPDTNKVILKLPISLLETIEERTGETISEAIEGMPYNDQMDFCSGKLRIKAGLFKNFFEEPVYLLVEHLRQLMTKKYLSDVSTILMVGGFSESSIMQDAIMKAFPDKKVIVPKDAGLAVLKGAVLFGHQSGYIPESNPPGLL